jgi:hypothetical protein
MHVSWTLGADGAARGREWAFWGAHIAPHRGYVDRRNGMDGVWGNMIFFWVTVFWGSGLGGRHDTIDLRYWARGALVVLPTQGATA